jgi:hypothetical protein
MFHIRSERKDGQQRPLAWPGRSIDTAAACSMQHAAAANSTMKRQPTSTGCTVTWIRKKLFSVATKIMQ